MSRVSRHGAGSSVSSSRRQAAGQAMTCNKCRKPLSTTLFVVACNCVFCEECTYSHFQTSPNCPSCNRVLSENDFTELVVADPSPNDSSTTTCFQSMFTKQNPKSQTLALQDVCANIMKRNDDLRAGTKFLMKQFLMESSKQSAKAGQVMQLLEKLRKENLALKQSQNSQKMKYEQTIEKIKQQLHSTQKKLAEREQQVMQFRSLHGSSSHKRNPSPHGPRHVSGAGMPPGSSHGPPQPPIQGFMIQREAQERAKQRKLETPQRRRPIMGGNASENYRPTSHAGGYNNPNHSQSHQGRFSGDSSVSPAGIRNITAATGFSFSGGQKKPRTPASGGTSPSHAFLSNPSGSYSRSQSPSSAFQNQSYSRRQY